MKKNILVLVFILILPSQLQGGFLDQLKDSLKGITGTTPTSESSLTAEEISKGLIEALQVGSERAVEFASAEGGFLNNPRIHIPLPGKLHAVADKLRAVGLSTQIDTFENTLNTAAEKASSEALPILGQAIKEITFDDVNRLWQGGDTAITDYFKEKTRQPIYDKYYPVVQGVTQQVGVTSSYQAIVNKPAVRIIATGMDMNTDVDGYVTGKALDGLYILLAEEEKQIRTNPVARTTDLLKRVFSKQ
jgi:hypothetical protein